MTSQYLFVSCAGCGSEFARAIVERDSDALLCGKCRHVADMYDPYVHAGAGDTVSIAQPENCQLPTAAYFCVVCDDSMATDDACLATVDDIHVPICSFCAGLADLDSTIIDEIKAEAAKIKAAAADDLPW